MTQRGRNCGSVGCGRMERHPRMLLVLREGGDQLVRREINDAQVLLLPHR